MKKRFGVTTDEMNKPKWAELPINSLKFANYQREVNDREVRRIARELDWDLFGVISVSFRDPDYYVVDGQHRIEALKLDKTITKVMCNVWEGLTYEQECEKFIKLNTARKTLNYNQIFNAMVEMGDKTAAHVVEILKNEGFDYAKTIIASKENVINPMQTIMRVYEQCGETILKEILYVLRRAWHGDCASLKCRIISALKTFLYENEMVDLNVLVSALSSTTPQALEIAGIALSANLGNIFSTSGHGKQLHIANAIKEVYNQKAPRALKVA